MTESMDQEKARARFDEIRARWEVQAEYAQVQGQYELLNRIGTWLEGAEGDPGRIVRAVQVLLTDPDRAGSSRSARLRALPLAEGGTAVLGESGVQIVTAQALVLSAFHAVEMEDEVTPRMVSALDVVRRGERERGDFIDWLRNAVDPPSEERHLSPQRLTPLQRIDISFGAPSIPATQWDSLAGNVPGPGWNWSSFSPNLMPVLTGLKTYLESLPAAGDQFSEALATNMQQWSQAIEAHVQESVGNLRGHDARQELLWWGQARYCHSLQEPFRRVNRRDPDEALWWAAWEAAQRASDVAAEPVAAYLVEVLAALGQPVEDETRPLSEWLRSLHAVLANANDAPPVNSTLKALVEADALALPVTWIRLHAAKGFVPKAAAAAVGLDLSTKIDRGQWASWVFRELSLDLLLHQTTS